MTTRIITGMELKYPDDEEKKNSVCRPMKVAQNPEDYFSCFLAHTSCQAAATAELGVWHMSSTRVNLLHAPPPLDNTAQDHLPVCSQSSIDFKQTQNVR